MQISLVLVTKLVNKSLWAFFFAGTADTVAIRLEAHNCLKCLKNYGLLSDYVNTLLKKGVDGIRKVIWMIAVGQGNMYWHSYSYVF